ncbi:putative molybdopterin binding domain-containing protein, partial [Flagelloscypha sp. PMI_526]
VSDEILNGKTLDRNSHCFAKFCFERGIELKGIEVVPDRENDIILASRRMVRDYDMVVTSGGIGSTHDDITYSSLAKAFFQNLKYHDETLLRMEEMNKLRSVNQNQTADQQTAMRRMALFPEKAQVIFVHEKIWVPVVCISHKLYIFPGIPALFEKMLIGLSPFLHLPPEAERPRRIQIWTESVSFMSPYLTELQKRLQPLDIQVGSYPIFGNGVYVSLIGRTHNSSGEIDLHAIAKEIEPEIGGQVHTEVRSLDFCWSTAQATVL